MLTINSFGALVGNRRTLLCVALVSALAMAFADRALATDGVIGINQAKVLASGGFPFKITQPGSYRLTSDLVVASTTADAIDVSSGNVSIDLGGFSIIGPGSGSGVGIKANVQSQVSVRNGAVTGMGDMGLFLGASCEVERMRITNNGDTGVDSGAGCTIVDNVVSGNGHHGISASGVIRDNTAIGNVDQGILGAGVIQNNTANKNFNGIESKAIGSASPLDTVTVIGNSANGNTDFGIFLDDGSGYSNNVLNDNSATPTGTSNQVSGGKQIGQNLCNGALCP